MWKESSGSTAGLFAVQSLCVYNMGTHWQRKRKLEAVLFQAQVSARSGMLLWHPGGAVLGQCEKGAKLSFLSR